MQELNISEQIKLYDLRTKTIFKRDLVVTFMFAFSMIVYEIFLTRLFAVILDYNYVFLVISLATLGIGIGGYLAYQFPFLYRKIYRFALYGQAIILFGTTAFIYLLPFQGIVVYSIITTIPFLFIGYVLASLFERWHDTIHIIYFTDLVGAGLGAVLAILLMNQLSPIYMISSLTLVMFLIGYVGTFRQIKKIGKVTTTILLGFLIVNMFQPFLTTERFLSYQTSPHTTFSDQEGDIVYSEWDAFSRTDVYDAKDGDFLYMTIDGGAVSPISRFDGEWQTVDYLKHNTSDLAFRSPSVKDRALIIGSGGGQEVLAAEMAGFSQIEALDINRGSFNAVGSLRSFAGGVFEREGVETIVADGRNYVRETTNTYDLIYLSLVTKQSDSGLGLALTENFIYTDEALHDYFRKLKHDGQLAFLLHDEKELAKIMNSAKSYYREKGVALGDIKNYMAIVGSYHIFGHTVAKPNSIERPLVLLKNVPFNGEEANALLEAIASMAQIPLHIPYQFDQYEALNKEFEAYAMPLNANRDAQPYFFHKNEGIPSFLWIGFVVISLVGMIVSFLYRKQLPIRKMIYFSGIGVGFMLIEITLIQYLTLLLGHPTLAFVVVLGTLLMSGGIGSMCSTRWKKRDSSRFYPLLLVAVLTSIVYLSVNLYYQTDIVMASLQRIMLVITLLFPLGFFIGMPFPYGVSRLKRQQTSISWGINGLMTVVGSLLAAILSLTFGMHITVFVGILIYFLLFALQPVLRM